MHVQRYALPQAETGHVFVHAIDAQLVGHVVEVGVVGAGDGQVQVHPAVAVAVPVAVLVLHVRQLEKARIEHATARRDHAGIEAGNGHHWLDGRAGRVKAAQHTVEQRTINRVAQFTVIIEADAGDEQVGVEARLTDHRHHLAGARQQRDDCTATTTERRFCGLLQVEIERQRDVLARYRIGTLEHAQDPAAGIGFDLFVADLAVQLVLVEFLDTGLADMVRAAVIDRVELLELLLVDSPDIAYRVREVRTLRVMPDQLRRHLDPRQAELIHGNARNLLLGQLIHDRYRLEWPAPLQHAFLEQPTLFLAELQHLDHAIEHSLPVAGAFAGDGQAETGPVVGDDPALAVEDQATIGRDRLNVDTVVLRQRRMVLELHHLQVVHPRHQHTDQ